MTWLSPRGNDEALPCWPCAMLMSVSLSIVGAGVLFNSPRPGLRGSQGSLRLRLVELERACLCRRRRCLAVPLCHAAEAARAATPSWLWRGARWGVARSIAALELFILKEECCCFFVCASGLVVVVVVARREGISPPTENPNQESRRIQTRNPARQTAKREQSQNQTGGSDLETFAFFTGCGRHLDRGERLNAALTMN